MKIAFACPQCGSRLSVDAALAGRSGRCRNCGQRLVIPKSSADGRSHGTRGPDSGANRRPAAEDELPDWRTAVANQLVAAGGAATAAGKSGRQGSSRRDAGGTDAGRRDAGGTDAGRRDAGGRESVTSGYSLRPVTPTNVPTLTTRDAPSVAAARVRQSAEPEPTPDYDFEPTEAPVARLSPDSAAYEPTPFVLAYRWLFGHLVQASTWISETSYTISFIVIILALAGGMTGRHALAQWGTLAIVALNLVGLAGDLASLVTLSFRRSPLQGGLFLVPPFTLYYLWTDWPRYRDAVGRMRIPLVTLAVVAAAYLLVPWLRGGPAGDGHVAEAVEHVIGEMEEGFGRPQGVVDEGLRRARAWLRESAGTAPTTSNQPPAEGPPAAGR